MRLVSSNKRSNFCPTSDKLAVGVIISVIVIGILIWFICPDSFIADDSYFYLVVSRNIARIGEQTFSIITSTNGVHPLWTYVLAGYSFLVHLLRDDLLNNTRFIVPLSGVLVTGGAIMLWRSATVLGINPLPLTLVSVCYILGCGILGSEGVMFFFSLSSVIYGLSVLDYHRFANSILLGTLCVLMVLSRLDSIFLIPPILIWSFQCNRNIKPPLTVATVFLIIMIPYLISNVLFFGGLMPVSGWMKGASPHMLRGFWYGRLDTNISGYSVIFGIVPIIMGSIMLMFRDQFSRNISTLLIILLTGCVGQCLYIMFFTRSHTLWYWYYILPVVLSGFVLSLSLNLFLQGRTQKIVCFVYITMILASFCVLEVDKYRRNSQDHPSDVAIAFVKNNHIDKTTILVSDWPGKLAFYTNNQILAADFLTTNIKFYQEMISSTNSLTWLFNQAESSGIPIKYIFLMGNSWLVKDTTNKEIIFNDPRSYPKPRIIGRMPLPDVHSTLESRSAFPTEIYSLR